MSERPRICVYCGSSFGHSPAFREQAVRVGEALGRQKIGLVYGGGRVGLMGVVADAALAAGAEVIGVIPEGLATHEIAHHGLTELHVVPGMHERKALMAALSQAFLTLPGGIGTYEEFFEILSWAGLGIHHKPMGLLNVEGYFDPLLALLEFGADAGFIRRRFLDPLLVSTDPEALVSDLLAYSPPAMPPKISADEA
ncbi:TIGR00730 family Rossman fold protein [Paludisphaera mucosa]|uniref:Cytokinin riboside 5'-monophosphate phosphoribohydrolase n=1 Tax=Paludisphaera mucosa TaxID=3030827 RepID=A0ABT6F729_9BACT|nr:TIGR00730 family Rossman fold protein [Paludisphaera mucosa]MDG3003380.1 TIGR00730 family Rossman fold protein [Paludisphaera mucosa]